MVLLCSVQKESFLVLSLDAGLRLEKPAEADKRLLKQGEHVPFLTALVVRTGVVSAGCKVPNLP